MDLEAVEQRRHQCGDAADLIGQGGQAQRHAFAGVALGLAVQRLMLAELLEHDHGQKVRSGPTPRQDMEGRRGLGHGLAVAAGKLLPHGLDHLPLARDHFQRLGHVLAQLRQARPAAAGAGRGRLDHDPLARQVFREGLAGRLLALEPLHRRGRAGDGFLGRQFVLGRRGFQFLQLQLELVQQPAAAL